MFGKYTTLKCNKANTILTVAVTGLRFFSISLLLVSLLDTRAEDGLVFLIFSLVIVLVKVLDDLLKSGMD